MERICFPEHGRSSGEILEDLERRRKGDVQWKAGKTWSLVYYLDEAHQDLLRSAYGGFFAENYLNSFVFPSLQQLERDVIRMGAELCRAPEAVGTMTSGGTESILLAVYTYREWARSNRRNRQRRVILAPSTVHPAFEKAAHLLDLELVRVPVRADKSADVAATARLIGPDTLMLVVSSPCYPFGVVDPVAEMGALADRCGLPMHVDACVGGFLLPWAEELGHWATPWDFRVSGVTSISLDVHKLGFAAKGASLILYRNMDWLKHQFFVSTEFPGGVYVSPTMLGTRPGGAIAAAWAAIQHLGAEGYREIVGNLLEAAGRLRRFFSYTPGLEVVGDSRLNLIAFRTVDNQPDIFAVGDFLEKRGWMVDRQQMPPCIHLTVLPSNLPVLAQYEEDVRAALAFARSHPGSVARGNAALYGVMARLPFRGMIGKNVRRLFQDLYQGGESVAEEGPGESWWMGLLNRFMAGVSRRKKRLPA